MSVSVSVISRGENDITEGLIILLQELTFNDAVWNYYNEPYLMVFFIVKNVSRVLETTITYNRYCENCQKVYFNFMTWFIWLTG